ncbi:hypothetical protein K439DRAFT_1383733 [Ramaria rubella]|nr:hypothetical protein K439DRAFT_1383733 [Ramaria rubella]
MPSRLELPQDKLLELAAQTLGIAPTSKTAIPDGYLEELRVHVKFSRDDTLFRVYPQPGFGFGGLLCLERGCEDIVIQLGPRSGVDKGAKEGVGSLSAYRVHVQDHPTHKTNRYARIKSENASQSSSRLHSATSVQLPGWPSSRSVPVNSAQKQGISRLPAVMGGSAGSSIRDTTSDMLHRFSVKAEDSDTSGFPPSSSPMVPKAQHSFNSKKRYSIYEDTDITVQVPSSNGHNSPVLLKKVKMEDIKGKSMPLGTVDPNSLKAVGTSNSSTSSTFLTLAAARQLLSDTLLTISPVRGLIAHFQNKHRKSPYDKSRLRELEIQLKDLLDTKTRCELTLANDTKPSVSGANSLDDIKRYDRYPTASDSNLLPASSYSKVEEAPGSFGGVPDPLSHAGPYAVPMVNSELPNYGDTIDDESDDDVYGARFRNRLINRGPVADPGDIDKFLIEAGNSESFDGNESVDKALAKLGLGKLGELLTRMSVALMPHQVIGVAWMLEHERGTHKGGILADEMGLGKTVQMIATMVQHRSDDPAVKSTLICAPVALLDQWKLEIETKTDGMLTCLIYHGSSKPKTMKELQKCDVILTTFQTLALESPDHKTDKKKKKKKSQGSDDFIETDSEAEKKVKKKGLLLRMSWFRVVLDEAQNIRNRNTRVSNAVTLLDTKYRWCLTGTPVTNSLVDCYAFVRFLEIRPWYDWQDFNGHIARLERRQPDLASSRLQVILNACLLRRKKDSVLDGKKLIELPPKDVVLRKLTFSQEERDIYNVIEKQSQAIINKYLRAGTILKNYSHVLVLLLRLRQLCSHPCLIQEGEDAFLLPDQDPTVKHEVQTELDRATILAGENFVTSMKAKFKEIALRRMAAEKASAEAVIEEEECPICFDTLTNPILTRCSHSFCGDCINAVLRQPPIEDGNEPRYAMSERPCPTCREPVTKEMIFQRNAFEPTDAELGSNMSSSAIVVDSDSDDGMPIGTELVSTQAIDKARNNSKVRAKRRFTKRLQESDEDFEDDDDDLSDFIVESDEDEEEKDMRRELKKKLSKNKRIVLDSDSDVGMDDEVELLPPKVVRKRKGKQVRRFLPSTKMKEMMVLLKEWAEAEETKNEKTMVISQWTSCLDLIANYLDENGFTFVRYQGNMTRSARDDAVRLFMSQGKARIMLMSLKCGGVGLNLTRANRVISLDLGWSSAVENQAFDRVHRLGQTRPVIVQRLVIEETVEARILALQDRKQNLADGSLGEGTGKKLGRLSVKDLANLFGLNVRGQLEL